MQRFLPLVMCVCMCVCRRYPELYLLIDSKKRGHLLGFLLKEHSETEHNNGINWRKVNGRDYYDERKDD